MAAYLFWYKFDEESITQYIWIIANKRIDAMLQFKRLYSGMYDYDREPCDVVPEAEFERPHEPNTVLGGNAII